MTNGPLLFRGVDRAAFAVGLVVRLRDAGVGVSASGPGTLVQALEQLAPSTRSQLYWATRLTLVNRTDDLPAFDSVFAAVFGSAAVSQSPRGPQQFPQTQRVPGAPAGDWAAADTRAALPWTTRPVTMTAVEEDDGDSATPDVLPSRLVARADETFDRFDPEDLRLIGSWLERATPHWPNRSSLRREPDPHGKRIDMRQTLKASCGTGWEMVTLARTRPRCRPRPVVLICDVSRSMQPYVTIYLHLMRAMALRPAAARPEVFAFSTSLTRLTAVLSHRSPEVALQRANAKVGDRYGGTRLAHSVTALLARPHGNALRDAVVVIASDGWDSEPPEVLDRALARLRRRAALLVWLNPRAAQRDFRPLAASMSVAVPYCDLLLPAHSLAGLRELFAVLAAPETPHHTAAWSPRTPPGRTGRSAKSRCSAPHLRTGSFRQPAAGSSAAAG